MVQRRTAERKAHALSFARQTLRQLDALGLGKAFVIGSLVDGTFMLHSDIDYWIEGELSWSDRTAIHRCIDHAMRGSHLPYDIVFSMDMPEERAKDFSHVKVDLHRVSQ